MLILTEPCDSLVVRCRSKYSPFSSHLGQLAAWHETCSLERAGERSKERPDLETSAASNTSPNKMRQVSIGESGADQLADI